MTTYAEIVEYLYTQLPMYQRQGQVAFKKDLGNITRLCSLLDDPHLKFKSVHIAGTNGKGSTAHMLAAVLQTAGYKTGLYTSPHLKDFRERVKINGKEIPQQEVLGFVNRYKKAFEEIQPSFFEWSVALAFYYFAREEVDIAIIETGLGGRFDSTNIITPLLSVITNIGFDHMQMLGDTLGQIAFEKAGIIKNNTPAVIGKTQAETKAVFLEKSAICHAPVVFADVHYNIRLTERSSSTHYSVYKDSELYLDNLECEFSGGHLKENLLTVIASLDMLKLSGLNITPGAIKEGLHMVNTLTGLRGRWEIISKTPLIVCDCAHNEDGLKQLFKHVNQLQFSKINIVFGTVNDKNLNKILPLLPVTAEYYFCRANIPRALDEKALQTKASSFKLKGSTYPSVKEAIISSKKSSNQNDLLLITGSNFVVAEALNYFDALKAEVNL